ncbi:Ras-related protein Rab-19 [Heterocephalus glaber]|uniref:Ras-related protein Rab-19 n=1 Tax=Heterocephalus glaber TaxID=10181 RepID=G5B566_HETGA|nr:Ras-related protein Rab-19 [Heterocephalus glaber]
MQFPSSARAADEDVDYLFKVILIGDSNVGKTCVVQHFRSGVYTETQHNTIGVDFTVRSLDIDGKRVKIGDKASPHTGMQVQGEQEGLPKGLFCWPCLMQTLPCFLQMQVWDTAGQERFRTITQSYYRSAHAAIIAYDLTQRSTFESVPNWIHEVEKYGAANLVIMLIGNKSDLWQKRHVLFEDACTLAEKYGLLAVLETSAKESRNIDEAFMLMAKELMARNSLQLYGEGATHSLAPESSPVLLAQAPGKKPGCTC